MMETCKFLIVHVGSALGRSKEWSCPDRMQYHNYINLSQKINHTILSNKTLYY